MDMKTYMEFNARLEPGLLVEARFTNSGHCKRFRGIVRAVNKSSVNVESLEPVWDGESAGRTFRIERVLSSRRWSENNGVFPLLPKYPV